MEYFTNEGIRAPTRGHETNIRGCDVIIGVEMRKQRRKFNFLTELSFFFGPQMA